MPAARRYSVRDRIHHMDLDRDALKVVRRLTAHGYAAYFVGGCVRDLLLGHRPKDFDIATEARPRQIKRLFRNSRIIGRRFRLVHITFADKVLEISTFRAATPPTGHGPDLLIRHDNTFGTLEEDAVRRDFTINGLFYDVDAREVIDCVGGMADLERRMVRTIGDPWVRYQEDPVRMLRAIKFAGRLDLEVDGPSYEAILDCHQEIRKAAVPRILEEILRLVNRGGAAQSMRLLYKTGLFHQILPEVAERLDAEIASGGPSIFLALLTQLDARIRSGPVPDAGLLIATLFAPAFGSLLHDEDGQDSTQRSAALLRALETILRPVALRLHMPKRDVYRAKQILIAQRRLVSARTGKRRSGFGQFLGRDYFFEALEFLRLWSSATGRCAEAVQAWQERLSDGRESVRTREPRPRGRGRRQ